MKNKQHFWRTDYDGTFHYDGTTTIVSRDFDYSVYTRDLFGRFIYSDGDGGHVFDYQLGDIFEDWLHPTEEEVTLFEMQFEIPYVPQWMLDKVYEVRRG